MAWNYNCHLLPLLLLLERRFTYHSYDYCYYCLSHTAGLARSTTALHTFLMAAMSPFLSRKDEACRHLSDMRKKFTRK